MCRYYFTIYSATFNEGRTAINCLKDPGRSLIANNYPKKNNCNSLSAMASELAMKRRTPTVGELY